MHATEGDTCIPDILQMRKFFLPPKESFKEPPPWNGWNVTSQIQNLFSVSDVTNSRVFEICRILVCNWHKPHFLSSLNGFSYFPLFLSTKTCYVPSINASGKWRNKLGQKLHILVIYTFLTQDTLLKRLLVGVLHWDWLFKL